MQIDSTNPSLRTVIYAVVSVLLAVALTFYFTVDQLQKEYDEKYYKTANCMKVVLPNSPREEGVFFSGMQAASDSSIIQVTFQKTEPDKGEIKRSFFPPIKVESGQEYLFKSDKDETRIYKLLGNAK
jgi:hypothetical protein